MIKFTIGINDSKAIHPLFPRSCRRFTQVANIIHIEGMKISKVKIATPSDIVSPSIFDGINKRLAQIFVTQYLVRRILPLNENKDEKNDDCS